MSKQERLVVWVGLVSLLVVLVAALRSRLGDRESEVRPGKSINSNATSKLPQNREGSSGWSSGDPPENGSQARPVQTDEWIADLFSRNRKAIQSRINFNRRFDVETTSGVREARLAAKVFPEATEKIALSKALDPHADPYERGFAIAMLNFLGREGRPAALAALQTLARDADDRIAGPALAGLAASDKDGQYRQLYWDGCRRGLSTSFNLVSYWYDAGTVAEMTALRAAGTNPNAEQVLQRMEILGAPDWEQRLETVLRDPENGDLSALRWVITVARLRQSTTLMRVLRDRLDLAHSEAKEEWGKVGGQDKALSFETLMSTSPEFAAMTNDAVYDDALVAFAEMGGKVTELERRRLRESGYLCDPKERLAELLSLGR